MSDKILEALALLEIANDDHWTEDGLPTVAVVRELTGIRDLTRADITAIAPEFTRESAAAPLIGLNEQEQGAREGAAPVDEVTALRARAQELADAIREKREAIDAQTRELGALVKQHDEVIQALDPGTGNHMVNQQNIMAHIRSQHELRMRRAQERQSVLKNLDPSSLDPRSVLDKSFARKNQRGAVPPTRRVAST